MTAFGNNLYVVPGGRDLSYTPNHNEPAIYHYNSISWNNITANTDPGMNLGKLKDLSTVSVDPSDSRRIYSGSWAYGLTEFYNDKMVERYGAGNSTLVHHIGDTDTSDIREISG
jgi:hypothetical protein